MLPVSVKISVTEDAKTAQKLLDTISKGFGAVYRPIGMVREAKAEIEIEELKREANERHQAALLRQQKNIRAIAEKTQMMLPEKASEEPVDEDWTVRFFKHAKDVGDQEMQTLWARILAGEIAEPGSYSVRTVDFLSTMCTDEAHMFADLCRFIFTFESGAAFLFSGLSAPPAWSQKYSFSRTIRHLSDIGLLAVPTMFTFSAEGTLLSYFDEQWKGMLDPAAPPVMLQYPIDLSLLTSIGLEIRRIANASKDESYAESAFQSAAEQLRGTVRFTRL